MLFAFDLLELDGEDLRGAPIKVRKATWRGSCASTDRGLRCASNVIVINLSTAKASRTAAQ